MKIETLKATFTSANILEVEAGTNCPQGGDAGHGGRTILKLRDQAATCWSISVMDEKGQKITINKPREIQIVLEGDCENETFEECLKFALYALNERRTNMEVETGKIDID